MFNNSTGFTMPVVPATYGTSYNNGNGMLGDGSWWAILIFFALFGGFGRGGFGGLGGFGGNYGENCATQADVRAAVDQQTLISKIDQQTYGMADSFTALNNTLNSNFRGIDNAICTLGYQNQQGFNALGSQLAMCCCDIERGIDGVNYNMAKNTCDITNTINNTTRDIIDNQNCNTRSILDFLVNDKLATLQAENQNLKLQASQAAQNAYLVNELRPCPIPAYTVANPYCCNGNYGYSNYSSCNCA